VKLWLAALALLVFPVGIANASSKLAIEGAILLDAHDYVGYRVFLKKAYGSRVTYGDWSRIKIQVNENAQDIGFDMIALWNARNHNGKSVLDRNLETADRLMLHRKFEAAFGIYQKMAQWIKKSAAALVRSGTPGALVRARDLNSIYPFVLQSMGRALYGAGRYEDALTTYGWIGPDYPRFRQVLFEKMWAAFRAGRVDIALGAIASQRSAYFSRFLSPESYLIQTYIYRKLCRTRDLQQVMDEMEAYSRALQADRVEDWAEGEVETRVLLSLSRRELSPDLPAFVSPRDREQEKLRIAAALKSAFEARKPKILSDLKTALAYVHLAGVTDSATTLKPVRKFTGREELLSQDLEIWPADSAEEWIDELGKDVFIGESLCGKDEAR
jgi:hypothetical protein